ncbi:hypothetical protein MKX08_001942 [Trichoderma sp. CBMAI-0020]|nr:hypothetical protein MKX08_001942 [Trichoderma sp. CBMAI-0020]WOD45891.1 hypothetical protein [Trichoderma atroviride]
MPGAELERRLAESGGVSVSAVEDFVVRLVLGGPRFNVLEGSEEAAAAGFEPLAVFCHGEAEFLCVGVVTIDVAGVAVGFMSSIGSIYAVDAVKISGITLHKICKSINPRVPIAVQCSHLFRLFCLEKPDRLKCALIRLSFIVFTSLPELAGPNVGDRDFVSSFNDSAFGVLSKVWNAKFILWLKKVMR